MSNKKKKKAIEIKEVDDVALWKQKKLVQALNKASGQGTSMITIIVPPDTQMARVGKMLTKEYGTATCIKSNITKKAVMEAIRSIQHAVKLWRKPPPHGLAIFCGTIHDGHKTKKQLTLFEPIKPLTRFMYKCDSSFHTGELQDMLHDEETYGFIIIDGSGTLMATLCGNSITVQNKYTTSLPKKHKAGGQSAPRFQRLRLNARNTYITKICEQAKDLFISRDSKVLIAGLIVAGLGELKQKLVEHKNFEPRLKTKVMKLIDVSYGMNSGLMEAVKASQDCLSHVKFIKEGRELEHFFNVVNDSTMRTDTRNYVNGITEVAKALDERIIATLICWEDLSIAKVKLRNKDDPSDERFSYQSLKKGIEVDEADLSQLVEDENKKSKKEGIEWEIVEKVNLLDWLIEQYKHLQFRLVLVSDQSDIGSQFVKGFGGIGGILKYEKELEWFDGFDYGADDNDFWGDDWSESDSDAGPDDADDYKIKPGKVAGGDFSDLGVEEEGVKRKDDDAGDFADLGDDLDDLGDDLDDLGDDLDDLGDEVDEEEEKKKAEEEAKKKAEEEAEEEAEKQRKAAEARKRAEYSRKLQEEESRKRKEAYAAQIAARKEKMKAAQNKKKQNNQPKKKNDTATNSKFKSKLSFTGYEFVPRGNSFQ